eukprot:s273_g6.t1
MMSGSPWCLPCLGVRQPQAGSRVVLNVGGHRFTTVRSTLTTGRAAGSVLADLVSGPCDQDGSYFLDHDGTQFHFVLNFLRHGPELFVAPERLAFSRTSVALLSLQLEAKAFGLADLVDLLESKKPLARAQQGHTGAYLNAEDYMGAPHPANEVERMAKLRSLNVIDTVNEDTEYDNITRAVASILQVPICLVSLVAEDKQWFKSKCGLDADETARSSSFCAYTLFPEAVEDARMLVVTDARHDIRFMKTPGCRIRWPVLGEPYIQFYAGCPLVTSEGLRLGSLCAIDRIPRDVRPAEVGLLINFAHLVVQALEDNHLEKLHQELRGEDSDEEPKEEEVHWYGGAILSLFLGSYGFNINLCCCVAGILGCWHRSPFGCSATSPFAVFFQIHRSHVSSAILGADGHLRRRSPGDQQRRWDYADGWSRRRICLRMLGRWNQ